MDTSGSVMGYLGLRRGAPWAGVRSGAPELRKWVINGYHELRRGSEVGRHGVISSSVMGNRGLRTRLLGLKKWFKRGTMESVVVHHRVSSQAL